MCLVIQVYTNFNIYLCIFKVQRSKYEIGTIEIERVYLRMMFFSSILVILSFVSLLVVQSKR